MAKKSSKKMHLCFSANANFTVIVPPDLLDSFKKDLSRGELRLNVQVDQEGIIYGYTIYADQATEGQIKFDLNERECAVSALCVIKKELDLSNDSELIKSVIDGGMSATLLSVGDHSLNDYYIDGQEEKTIEFAKLSVTA